MLTVALLAGAPSSFLLISVLTIVLRATVFYSCRVQVLLRGLLRSQWIWEGEGKVWIANSGWRDREGVTSVGAGRVRGYFFQGVNLGYRKEKYFWDSE